MRAAHETNRPLAAFLTFSIFAGSLGLAGCTKREQGIPLCGIPIAAIEQPNPVDRIAVNRNPDRSFGPALPKDVLDKIAAATVKITYTDDPPFGRAEVRNGSGVIVNGRIVTAAHVIAGLDPSKIAVSRADGSPIPISQSPYDHCVEFITDGVRTAPKKEHDNATLDAAILTPAGAIEPGLTFGKPERNWVVYGGYGGRDTSEFAAGAQLITGSNAEFPNAILLTGINGAPTEPGDSGGPVTNYKGECTGIVVGLSTRAFNSEQLGDTLAVDIEPGDYQLTYSVVAKDLEMMMGQLDRLQASPRQ